MSHLKCYKHNRRAMVLQVDDQNKTVHREDGSACSTSLLVIGGQHYAPWEVELRGLHPLEGQRERQEESDFVDEYLDARPMSLGEWVEVTDFKTQTGW